MSPFRYLILLIIFNFISSYSQYGIVVNKDLYDNNSDVRSSIDGYINAIINVDHKTMWLYEYNFNSNNFSEDPQALRNVIQNHYFNDSPRLEGVVFVGDLPWVLTTDNLGNSGPFETYWMDMDGSYTSWSNSGSALYGTQANGIEIWESRVCSHNLTMAKDGNGNLLSEHALVANYFDKVVGRMTQISTVPFDMACFASDESDFKYPRSKLAKLVVESKWIRISFECNYFI